MKPLLTILAGIVTVPNVSIKPERSGYPIEEKVPYYHIVFTIPNILNALVLVNKRQIYGVLFKAASETLLRLGQDPKHLGADIGIVAILHTWGQTLTEHPKILGEAPKTSVTPNTDRYL